MRSSALAIALLVSACDAALDPSGPAWRAVPTLGVPARWGHVAIYDQARDRMVVFGGDGPDGQRNDLWSLDLAALTWHQLPASSPPGPRTDLAGIYDAKHDRLVIIGGRVGFASSIDEVWEFSFATSTWSPLPSGPTRRHDISATTDGARAWVFGGAGEFLQSLDDLWQLDLSTNNWTKLTDDGNRPSARTSGAFEYFDGALYVSGGHDATAIQGDSWRYDLGAHRWSKLSLSSGPIGGAHFGHALDPTCGALMLSAGDNLDNYDTAYTSALVVRATPHFALIRTSNLPPPRDHPSMIFDAARRRLLLYGGGTLGDGLGVLGDAWSLSLGACP